MDHMHLVMDYVMLVHQDVLLVMEETITIVYLVQADSIYIMLNVITHAQLDTLLMILPILVSHVHSHVKLVLHLNHVTLVMMVTTYMNTHVLMNAQLTSDIMVIPHQKNVNNVTTLARPVLQQTQPLIMNVNGVQQMQIVYTDLNVHQIIIVHSQALFVSIILQDLMILQFQEQPIV